MSAPAICVVAAQPPTPPASKSTITTPASRWRWMTHASYRRGSGISSLSSCRRRSLITELSQRSSCSRAPAFRNNLERPRHRRAAAAPWPGLRPSGRWPAARPLIHDKNLVDAGDRARPMRDDDDDAVALAHAENRLGQSFVALRVEIGIGLVEHDQERIAIERAGERDALRLAGRERSAVLADLASRSLPAAARSDRARRPPWPRQ